MTVSLSRLAAFYGDLDAQALLRVMIGKEFVGEIALISSFGADAVLLLSIVADIDPATPVLFLETGKHFGETLSYVEQVEQTLGLTNVRRLTPDVEKLGRIDPNEDLWSVMPNRCCWLRKVEPLQREIAEQGYKALITGRKRHQTKERESLEMIELDADGIFRINPLAYWSKEQMDAEHERRGLPRHPLLEQGYLSIGCAPCTRPVADGEDERAGRWAHTIGLDEEQKTECGIHLPEAADWSV